MSISDFEILSKLGDGAFSSVFKVMRKSDGQHYALKKVKLGALKQKEKENALNEVRILASVSHPNIIAYKEAFFDESANTLCIVMELAECGDLLKKISNHKAARTFFPENEVWTCLVHVVQGLKVLHDCKILHRDLKCANIFVAKEGIMKLGDLNVSKVNKRGLAYTQTGTPYYASPEVWKDQPYNSSSDIWSLGCVIYEMAALVPPFTASDMQGLYKKIIRGVYPNIPSQYSSDLSNVIRTLLQVNPTLRPTCDKILEMPPVQRHIHIQLLPNPQTADLLGTIKFEPGKNLKQKLPAPNYDSRNRGLSAHSARPKVEENQPPARVASARGGRDPKGQVDGSRPQPRIAEISKYEVPSMKPEINDYKPQVRDRYAVGSNQPEPVRKPLNVAAPIGDLYRIPEAKEYNPYNAPYRPEKYTPSYADQKPVSKVPSNDNLYKPPSRENLNYLNSPNKALPSYSKPSDNLNLYQGKAENLGLYSKPAENPVYMNKPPSRDRPSAYVASPAVKESPKVQPSYVPPASRERPTPSYMDKREVPPSREKPSYQQEYRAPSRDLPSRDKVSNVYQANPNPAYNHYNPPASREKPAVPYSPSYQNPPVALGQNRVYNNNNLVRDPISREPARVLPSREAQRAPPSREAQRAPPSREAQRAPPSREAQRAPPSREAQRAPGSREGRPASREVENKNFNRIGALVLQSPKQLVPKAMPSPGGNQAVRAPYMQQDKRQQRINPVWWG